MKKNIRSFLLLFFILFIFTLFIEDIFPVVHINNVITQDAVVKPPEKLKKMPVLFDIQTEYNGNSLITLKDLTEIANKKVILLKNNPLYFERKVNDGYIFVTDNIKCKSVFSIKYEKEGFLALVRKLKFYLIYPFNKELAFYEKYKNLRKDTLFGKLNPLTDECFIGKTDATIILKKVNNFAYPDLNLQVKLLRTFEYLPLEFDKKTFYYKKYMIKEHLGSSYTSFYFSPDFDFYIKANDDEYPLGTSISLDKNPTIFIRKPKGKYIIGVFKNGDVVKYYNSSFLLKPKNPGYYFFVVYRYSHKFFGGFYTSFEPILITNPFFIQ